MRALKHELEIGQVDAHRHEECTHYDDCLYKASRSLLASFSCANCEDYKPGEVIVEPPKREETVWPDVPCGLSPHSPFIRQLNKICGREVGYRRLRGRAANGRFSDGQNV